MKISDWQEITSSSEWMRINYQTLYSSGSLIMKTELFRKMKVKKFEKLFKDAEIEIIMPYQISMRDIVESALRELKKRFDYKESIRTRELSRIYEDYNYIDILTTELVALHKKIVRLEKKL